MDFQPEAVDYLRQQLGIPAVCADAAQAAKHFPPASFDVITAFYVLEHVPDVQAVLPGAAATHTARAGRFQTVVTSALAVSIGVLAIPWCLVENDLVHRPAIGLVFAHKPHAG